MAMAFRITTKGDVDVWSFFCIETAEADVKVLTVDASVRGRGIDSVPVSFIDERFGNPTNGVWYLARSQFEAVPMMPRVPWRSFVESECHTLPIGGDDVWSSPTIISRVGGSTTVNTSTGTQLSLARDGQRLRM